MNWDDVGAYGHPTVRTPHIDKLAENGILFKHAYLTTNSCSPSRASLITGQYPHNTGAEQLHWPIPEDKRTFVEALKSAGYYTAAAGKWHMGEAVKEHFDAVVEGDVAGFQLPTTPGNSTGNMIAADPSGCSDWVPTLQNRPKDKPFFMWFAAFDPHREYQENILEKPNLPEDVIIPPYTADTPESRKDFAQYYDEITRLDSYIGAVVEELTQQGVIEDTLILFITDNGRPFPRDKTTLYDGGIRTPFVLQWPANVEAGIHTKSLVSSIDIAPTFLEIAGVDPLEQLEGVSFLPILMDPQTEIREYAFAEDHWHDYEDHGRSVQNQNFKLIKNTYPELPPTPSADIGRALTWQSMLKLEAEGGLTPIQRTCLEPRAEYELYDLRNDPYELNNVAENSRYEYIFATLKNELEEQFVRSGDFIPSKRTPDEFFRDTGQPDHSVRKRPRASKMEMYGTTGAY